MSVGIVDVVTKTPEKALIDAYNYLYQAGSSLKVNGTPGLWAFTVPTSTMEGMLKQQIIAMRDLMVNFMGMSPIDMDIAYLGEYADREALVKAIHDGALVSDGQRVVGNVKIGDRDYYVVASNNSGINTPPWEMTVNIQN